MTMSVLEASTVVLLHFNEASGAFVDSGSTRRTPNIVGSFGSSASSKFGAYCYQGASSQTGQDGLELAAFADSSFPAPGNLPYTIDLWVYPTATPTSSSQCLFCLGSFAAQSIFLGINTAGKLQLYTTNDANSGTTLNGTTTIPLNQWSHVAACRDTTGTTRLFVGGVVDGSDAAMNSKTNRQSGSVAFGYSHGSSGRSYTGRADEFRYVVGLGLFTADFSASLPSAAYSTPASAKENGVLTVSQKVRQSSLFSSTTWKKSDNATPMKDLYDGGRGRVRGTVKEKATPSFAVHREVRLIRERDSRCVRSQWSDATTGAYDFTNIDETVKYTVSTYDYEHDYRAVVADNITPELM